MTKWCECGHKFKIQTILKSSFSYGALLPILGKTNSVSGWLMDGIMKRLNPRLVPGSDPQYMGIISFGTYPPLGMHQITWGRHGGPNPAWWFFLKLVGLDNTDRWSYYITLNKCKKFVVYIFLCPNKTLTHQRGDAAAVSILLALSPLRHLLPGRGVLHHNR